MKQRLNHEAREDTQEDRSVMEDHRSESSLTFDTPETMIRQDAAQTPLPPGMTDRIMRSLASEENQETSAPWWKRWMPF